jgi:hypothetical protein
MGMTTALKTPDHGTAPGFWPWWRGRRRLDNEGRDLASRRPEVVSASHLEEDPPYDDINRLRRSYSEPRSWGGRRR